MNIGQDQRELDDRLAALAVAGLAATGDHCLGSMRSVAPSLTPHVRPAPIGVIP